MSAMTRTTTPIPQARFALRRAAFVTVACILASSVALGGRPESLALGLGAAAVLLALSGVLRRLHLRPETLGLGGVLGAVVGALAPLPAEYLIPSMALGTIVAHGLLFGGWSERLGLRFDLKRRRSLTSPLSADRLWRGLVPGASHPDDHFSGRLIDFDRDRDDLDTLYLRMDAGDHRHHDMTVTILAQSHHRHCRYMIEAEGGDMLVDLVLAPAPGGRHKVDCQIVRHGLGLAEALDGWFGSADLDFALGRNLRSLQSARPTAAKATASLPHFGLRMRPDYRAST